MVVPANAIHFWHDGDVVAHRMQEFRPALHIDRLFETLFGLANEGKLNVRGMPSLLQPAVMLPEYHRENRPARPPFRLPLPLALLLWPVAYLLGCRATYPRYHQFSRAPGSRAARWTRWRRSPPRACRGEEGATGEAGRRLSRAFGPLATGREAGGNKACL
jgi:hypothetical protein